jgi:aryl-alcohol dehydrogenase-like predicted oxidoreductase
MGRLTGKYSASNPIPKGRRFSSGFTWEQLEPLLSQMKTLADKYGVSISAIALNWVISKGAIPLGGARNGKQARENAKAADFRLSEEDVEALAKFGFEGTT